MITEDYVSFETAKLLKEKGFDEATFHDYDEKGIRWFEEVLVDHNSQGGVACPTIQMVMKWLRNNFNLNPVPYALSFGWAFDVFDLSDRDITGCKKLYSMNFPTKNTCYETYEEAAEAAIKYCLKNLI